MIGGLKHDGDSVYQPGGWVCGPGFGELVFYDPEDFRARISGALQPWEVIPYATWRPPHLWRAYSAIGGIAYDQTNRIFYMIEREIGPGAEAIVHVYQLQSSSIFQDSFESGGLGSWQVTD